MKIYATSLLSVLLLSLVGCGGESKSETAPVSVDAKYLVSYKGLDFYKQNTPT